MAKQQIALDKLQEQVKLLQTAAAKAVPLQPLGSDELLERWQLHQDQSLANKPESSWAKDPYEKVFGKGRYDNQPSYKSSHRRHSKMVQHEDEPEENELIASSILHDDGMATLHRILQEEADIALSDVRLQSNIRDMQRQIAKANLSIQNRVTLMMNNMESGDIAEFFINYEVLKILCKDIQERTFMHWKVPRIPFFCKMFMELFKDYNFAEFNKFNNWMMTYNKRCGIFLCIHNGK